MKIATIVGARPQFIKAAAGSRQLRKEHQEVLIHTGQHFDDNMSAIFFREMEIPEPDYNLNISGGTHAQMTARMLVELEKVLLLEKPEAVLVYGDTNSTLAAALSAAKLHISVIHVEAGNRVGTLRNPEEVNRICTDHVSALRFACVSSAMDCLAKENLLENAYLVGDPMYDAFVYYSAKPITIKLTNLKGQAISLPETFQYLTCHREENTADKTALMEILSAIQALPYPTIYPVHPRNRAMACELEASEKFPSVRFVEPLGYLSSIALIQHAQKIVTDSGGVQREAFFAGVQCVTVLDFVCWPETMIDGRNQLAKPERHDILEKLHSPMAINPDYHPFGDGKACEKICDVLRTWQPERG